jgi:hypothetical protein
MKVYLQIFDLQKGRLALFAFLPELLFLKIFANKWFVYSPIPESISFLNMDSCDNML